MDSITVKNNQSLFDLAVEHLGSVEGVLDLAFANNLSLTEDLPTATNVVKIAVTDPKTATLFGNLHNKPATGLTDIDQELVDSLGEDPTNGIFDNTFDNTYE